MKGREVHAVSDNFDVIDLSNAINVKCLFVSVSDTDTITLLENRY